MSEIIEGKTLYKGRFVSVVEKSINTPHGIKSYECIKKEQKSKIKKDFDGVTIVALVEYKKSNKPKDIILIHEFRPSLGKKVWTFPTGLVDLGESVEEAAVRELKEETGYTGIAVKTTPRIATSVEYGDTYVKMVTVNVDGESEININPKQHLGASENITAHLIPLNNLLSFLDELPDDDAVSSRLYCLASWNEMTKF
ncbi:ADP-sugar pyrophosphatase [Entamoeba marina]